MATGHGVFSAAASVPMAGQFDTFVGHPVDGPGIAASGWHKIYCGLCVEQSTASAMDQSVVSSTEQSHEIALGCGGCGGTDLVTQDRHSYLGSMGCHADFKTDSIGGASQSLRTCGSTSTPSHS